MTIKLSIGLYNMTTSGLKEGGFQLADDRFPCRKRPSLRHPGVLLATWFGVGYLPKAPGTWGSLAALPCAFGIQAMGGRFGLGMACAVVFALGLWSVGVYLRESGGKDPGPVVIDEVAGQWLTLLFAPNDLYLFLAGFVFFRFADILKPWPLSWADRAVKGPLGVMLDDLLAAVYAGAALYALAGWLGL